MTFPKARLVVSAILFLGWLGFLLYLVLDSSTIILSRPQFLIAQLYVIADIGEAQQGLDPKVKIDEVLWSADPKDANLTSQTITLLELTLCEKKHGSEGAGKYILPLQKSATGRLIISPIPREMGTRELRVYPLTPGTRAQVDAMIRAK